MYAAFIVEAVFLTATAIAGYFLMKYKKEEKQQEKRG